MTQHKVLDHGYVELVDHMGDDLTVVNAARVSFKKRSTWISTSNNSAAFGNFDYEYGYTNTLRENDQKLIRFLASNGHWSPFSHPQLMFEVRAPLMVINQWRKHRIGMAYTDEDEIAHDAEGHNEASLRYIEASDFYLPTEWRSAPDNKKQGSGPRIDAELESMMTWVIGEGNTAAFEGYKEMLNHGIAPEQARLVLPAYALYTTMYWTTSLFGVTRFLNLRMAEDAQFEIRQYANTIEPIVRELFPYSSGALLDVSS